MKNIYAIIITIGDELLIGQVIDTNSGWIAQRLNEVGIMVKKRISIGDIPEEMVNAIDLERKNADIILLTGGLGPTSDDKTKEVLGDYFNGKMVVNEVALANVTHLFENIYKKPVSKVNLEQAEVPDVCEVIQNKRGSAPGMVFKKEGTIFISMPGVPYEMKGMMQDVIPYLQKEFKTPVIIHKTIVVAGIGESAMAEIIADFEKALPKKITLAYLPNYGLLRLRLSVSGFDKESVSQLIEERFEQLKELAKDYIVADQDDSLQVILGKILSTKKQTIATAESCTGGGIAALITSVPGASAYFEGSVVSYSNRIKEEIIGVKKETLSSFGAVSEQTVIEMLQGILDKFNTNYGISVSGILGPDGGTPDKPVGTVWVAVGNKEKYQTQLLHLRFDRDKNREVCINAALNMMRQFILSE